MPTGRQERSEAIYPEDCRAPTESVGARNDIGVELPRLLARDDEGEGLSLRASIWSAAI